MIYENVSIETEYITLDSFLKWVGIADTGGQAKSLIVSGNVRVNGEVELRRGRKLRAADRISTDGKGWKLIREEG